MLTNFSTEFIFLFLTYKIWLHIQIQQKDWNWIEIKIFGFDSSKRLDPDRDQDIWIRFKKNTGYGPRLGYLH